MTIRVAALIAFSIGLGIIVSFWYSLLGVIERSPRFEQFTHRVKPRSHRFHFAYELLFVVFAPLFVIPFAALLVFPIELAVLLGVKNPLIGVSSPILALLALGIAHRILRSKSGKGVAAV